MNKHKIKKTKRRIIGSASKCGWCTENNDEIRPYIDRKSGTIIMACGMCKAWCLPMEYK